MAASGQGTFNPGDQVRARLYPELGTGEVLRTFGTANNGVRMARVRWATGQESTHSFAALKHATEVTT